MKTPINQTKLKEIKQLLEMGLTHLQISRATGIARQTVGILGIAWNMRRPRGRKKLQADLGLTEN